MDKACFVLLIAEDEQDMRSMWKQEIDEFNIRQDSVCIFKPCMVESSDQTIAIFESQHVDCAIIDLRLPKVVGRSADNTLGNTIIENNILNQLAIPVVIVSGVPSYASEAIKAAKIQILPKEANSYPQALEWLARHADLMETLRDVQKFIRQETGKIFHQVLWPRWEKRNHNRSDKKTLKKALTRQIVSHLAESLALPGDNPRFMPDEFYIEPPIRTDRLHTGDLLEIDDTVWIILTPQCNMVRQYPENILVAMCSEDKGKWQEICDGLKAGSNNKREKYAGRLSSYINQGHDISSHFLPPCGKRGPWFVNFKELKTHPSHPSYVAENLMKSRFASLAPAFIPNLVQRFAAYMGRIGEPEIDPKEVAKLLVNINIIKEES